MPGPTTSPQQFTVLQTSASPDVTVNAPAAAATATAPQSSGRGRPYVDVTIG